MVQRLLIESYTLTNYKDIKAPEIKNGINSRICVFIYLRNLHHLLALIFVLFFQFKYLFYFRVYICSCINRQLYVVCFSAAPLPALLKIVGMVV